jgi:hypothetical protein
MKTKPLTLLLALTFLIVFSGSSVAGLFSPADSNECFLENLKNTTNPSSSLAITIMQTCQKQYAIHKGVESTYYLERKKLGTHLEDSWWWKLFGPKTKSDCILKYSKGVRDRNALRIIGFMCKGQRQGSKDTD